MQIITEAFDKHGRKIAPVTDSPVVHVLMPNGGIKAMPQKVGIESGWFVYDATRRSVALHPSFRSAGYCLYQDTCTDDEWAEYLHHFKVHSRKMPRASRRQFPEELLSTECKRRRELEAGGSNYQPLNKSKSKGRASAKGSSSSS